MQAVNYYIIVEKIKEEQKIIETPKKLVEKEGSIFNVKYKSWKEKYCPMVEFIDE